MRCKIVRTQKFMWPNIMRSTKSKKVSVLHYSIDIQSQSPWINEQCANDFFFLKKPM